MRQATRQSYTTISFRLPVEMAEELREWAKRNDRPVSLEVRRAVRLHLDQGKAKA